MVAGLLARLLSKWVTSKVTEEEGIFSLMPSEWREVCPTGTSFPFLVNAVFLVLCTDSWPMFRNVWPLKMPRKIGKT